MIPPLCCVSVSCTVQLPVPCIVYTAVWYDSSAVLCIGVLSCTAASAVYCVQRRVVWFPPLCYVSVSCPVQPPVPCIVYSADRRPSSRRRLIRLCPIERRAGDAAARRARPPSVPTQPAADRSDPTWRVSAYELRRPVLPIPCPPGFLTVLRLSSYSHALNTCWSPLRCPYHPLQASMVFVIFLRPICLPTLCLAAYRTQDTEYLR